MASMKLLLFVLVALLACGAVAARCPVVGGIGEALRDYTKFSSEPIYMSTAPGTVL